MPISFKFTEHSLFFQHLFCLVIRLPRDKPSLPGRDSPRRTLGCSSYSSTIQLGTRYLLHRPAHRLQAPHTRPIRYKRTRRCMVPHRCTFACRTPGLRRDPRNSPRRSRMGVQPGIENKRRRQSYLLGRAPHHFKVYAKPVVSTHADQSQQSRIQNRQASRCIGRSPEHSNTTRGKGLSRCRFACSIHPLRKPAEAIILNFARVSHVRQSAETFIACVPFRAPSHWFVHGRVHTPKSQGPYGQSRWSHTSPTGAGLHTFGSPMQANPLDKGCV